MIDPAAFTFHEWMDFSQSVAMAFIVITQVVILWVMRSEMRRAISTATLMGRAMGESGEINRRLDQLEEDVADLAMRLDGQRVPKV